MPDPSPPPATTVEAYDCNTGLADWETSWEPEKQKWCCSKKGVGCPTQTVTTSHTATTTSTSGFGSYDCDVDFEKLKTEWDPVHKAWCCEHAGKGCADSEPASCSDFQCPPEHVKKANAEELFCSKETCQSSDVGTCCDEETRPPVTPSCSMFTCPDGYFAKEGNENLFCSAEPCDVAVDTLQCCNKALVCDLNCYGDGAANVVLPGATGEGDAAFVAGLTRKQCNEKCISTAECEAVVFGETGGQCWGKKDVHTSKCQPGGGFTTEVLRARPWGKCVLMGDPHIIPFDRPLGPDLEALVPGEYWLIKSPELLIQGRFDFTERFPKDASTVGISVGGSLVGDHTLAVEYVGGKDADGKVHYGPKGFRVAWDGKQIFGKDEAEQDSWKYKSADNDMEAASGLMDPSDWHRDARHTIGDGELAGKKLPSFVFKFKKADVNIYLVLGPDNCNAIIEAKKAPGTQDGYCGNFNCEPDDDAVEELKSRGLGAPIDQKVSLFASSGSKLGPPASPATAPVDALDSCDPKVKTDAEEKCKGLEEFQRKDCVFDACAAGDTAAAVSDAAVGALAKEVEDEEEGHSSSK
jgi:hypothetical protein